MEGLCDIKGRLRAACLRVDDDFEVGGKFGNLDALWRHRRGLVLNNVADTQTLAHPDRSQFIGMHFLPVEFQELAVNDGIDAEVFGYRKRLPEAELRTKGDARGSAHKKPDQRILHEAPPFQDEFKTLQLSLFLSPTYLKASFACGKTLALHRARLHFQNGVRGAGEAHASNSKDL